jgi:hypothetical protein
MGNVFSPEEIYACYLLVAYVKGITNLLERKFICPHPLLPEKEKKTLRI